MMMNGKQAEDAAVLATAQAMCVAARTAPRTKGMDYIHTGILTGKDLEILADEMDRLAEELGFGFFHRDSNNVRISQAVVLIGIENVIRGLNEGCQFCGFANCKACTEAGGRCAYTGIDLGIAIGSAVDTASDAHVDNRVMFSAGRSAMELKLLGDKVCQIIAIPLSVSGKSPFFDRK